MLDVLLGCQLLIRVKRRIDPPFSVSSSPPFFPSPIIFSRALSVVARIMAVMMTVMGGTVPMNRPVQSSKHKAWNV